MGMPRTRAELVKHVKVCLGDRLTNIDEQAEPLTVEVNATDLSAACLALRDDENCRFEQLTDLSGVDLTGANLESAVLKEAKLPSATFTDASLKFADLRETNLKGVSLKGVDLSAADTRNATMATRLDSLSKEIVKAHALWISTDGVRGTAPTWRAAISPTSILPAWY